MKTVFCIPVRVLLTCCAPYLGMAQPNIDSVYNEVIKINSQHVVELKGNYLIDIAVDRSAASPVFYYDAKIPPRLLQTAWPELTSFTVISPDWEYYGSVVKWATENGLTSEPVASSVIYTIQRTTDGSNSVSIDSLKMQGEYPRIRFRKKDTTSQQLAAVYYTERYGSVCCPRDPARDSKVPSLSEFVRYYEQKHSVKIAGTYTKIQGREGEHTSHYTLANLSPEQKMKFIIEYRRYIQTRQDRPRTDETPRIITPHKVNIEDFRLEESNKGSSK